jgi:hypothetical protein
VINGSGSAEVNIPAPHTERRRAFDDALGVKEQLICKDY